MNAQLSVIIPVLNEAGAINETLGHLKSIQTIVGLEIIVVDGDVNGSTIAEVQSNAVDRIHLKTITSKSGRAVQMNTGARIASGATLLFLHADTTLSQEAIRRLPYLLQDRSLTCGAFTLGIRSPKKVYRLIETMANLRSRMTRLPYGDQAQFFKSDYFRKIGGYSEIPLMEDVEIMQRVKKRNDTCRIVPEKVFTSARRWEKEGALYGTMRNWTLITLYTLGVSPQRLVRYYRWSDGKAA